MKNVYLAIMVVIMIMKAYNDHYTVIMVSICHFLNTYLNFAVKYDFDKKYPTLHFKLWILQQIILLFFVCILIGLILRADKQNPQVFLLCKS